MTELATTLPQATRAFVQSLLHDSTHANASTQAVEHFKHAAGIEPGSSDKYRLAQGEAAYRFAKEKLGLGDNVKGIAPRFLRLWRSPNPPSTPSTQSVRPTK